MSFILIKKYNLMEKCKNGCCQNIMAGTAVALSAITLVGGAVLGTCVYQKVNTLYKATVELQFGSQENFEALYEARMTPETKKQLDESIKQAIEQMKAQQGTSDENSADAQVPADESGIDTKAAFNDTKWEENSKEAASLFELSGTPGNAVINVKNGNFKAIGGAYPQSAFEIVIADLKAGKELATDDMGKAGKLTNDQITALLKNAHFKGDSKAEIVIVEYSDLLCPFCKRHYNDKTLENIVDADKNVALVFKNMPITGLHPNAPLGAKGVKCAGDLGGAEKFYAYLDKAFAANDFNGTNVVDIAEEIGLDKDAFVACFTK